MIDATEFINGYIEAALWTTNRDDLDPEGTGEAGFLEDYVGIDDLRHDERVKIDMDCLTFMLVNADALSEYCERIDRHGYPDTPSAFAGHDYWLTRNGHGAGFWDRDLGELGEKLSEASKRMGEAYIDISYFRDEAYA